LNVLVTNGKAKVRKEEKKKREKEPYCNFLVKQYSSLYIG